MYETGKNQNKLRQVLCVELLDVEYEYLKKNLADTPEIDLKRINTTDFRKQFTGGKEKAKYQTLLVISENQEILEIAETCHLPAIGYQPENSENVEYLKADMVVEGFEEVDAIFLQHVYERFHGVPWTILETERLIVRELAIVDLEELFQLYEGAGMTDYMEGLYPYEQEKEYQQAYIANMYGYYGYGMWLVFEKSTGKLVGRAGIEHRKELNGALELGYAIGTEYQRKGYATEVCKAIIRYAKEELGFREIHCLIDEKNLISIHLAEKLGFVRKENHKINEQKMIEFKLG